jgi:hypothetical protein
MSRSHPVCSAVAHAGYMTCPICEAPGYATEATWLDGDRVLATFIPSCDHGPAETHVVDACGVMTTFPQREHLPENALRPRRAAVRPRYV